MLHEHFQDRRKKVAQRKRKEEISWGTSVDVWLCAIVKGLKKETKRWIVPLEVQRSEKKRIICFCLVFSFTCLLAFFLTTTRCKSEILHRNVIPLKWHEYTYSHVLILFTSERKFLSNFSSVQFQYRSWNRGSYVHYCTKCICVCMFRLESVRFSTKFNDFWDFVYLTTAAATTIITKVKEWINIFSTSQ